jgi:CHASE2 domain-containing sensor protein
MPDKSKLVVLRLEGNLEQDGFQVILEIGQEGERSHLEKKGFLPASQDLIACLEEWEKNYRSLEDNHRLTPVEIRHIKTVTSEDFTLCQQLAKDLGVALNFWLASPAFREVDNKLREQLHPQEKIRLLLRTQDSHLRRLPWDLWNFIEKYRQAEIALAPLNCELIPTPAKSQQKVSILAILGDSRGIDVQADRLVLESLPHAEVTFLVEPKRAEINDHLWEKSWDILFFAGHSETKHEKGLIHINQQESLTLDELTYSLQRAIEHGLQLAIFNSCDGLGLLKNLEQLNLPQMILMREPVPDYVAQSFLKNFLQSFSQGNQLYLAHREARERLQGLEDRFPCASWLPVIYQNPATIPWHWPQPKGVNFPRPSWQNVSLVSSAMTAGIITLRSLGALQGVELQTLDLWQTLRPPEPPDPRLVVVTVSEGDIQYQQKNQLLGQGSLSDLALGRLLDKLLPYQPRVIASDIVHDFPFHPDVAKTLPRVKSFIGVCRVGNEGKETSFESIAPAPNLTTEQLGFSNLVLDGDEVIRRQIIGMSADEVCPTDQSLSLRIALAYLQNVSVEQSPEGLTLGKQKLPPLEHNSGGYQMSDQEVGGYQILVNYRARPPVTLALEEILSGKRDRELSTLVKDKIVLIGVTRANQDKHFTPFSRGKKLRQAPGVFIHAQMVSQLLSAVEEGRPLLGWWPQWLEVVWIVFWGALGTLVFWWWRSLRRRLGFLALASLALTLGSWLGFLLFGVWIPFVPSLLALGGTGLVLSLLERGDKNAKSR